MKSIPPRERLIFALDVADADAARRLVETLGDSVVFYKLGLELLMSGGYFPLLDWLATRGNKLFADVKFFDIPATVAGALRQLNGRGITFTTVHGNQGIMEAAVAAARDFQVLAVTVLTSLDGGDLEDLGVGGDLERVVIARARRALAAGCAGVVASGMETEAIRRELGPRLLIVTPGIRPLENRAVDDQKRVLTVERAFAAGADYVVVGRPIRDAADPRAAAESIQAAIVAASAHG
jgi:orotidine-5'-phosphate decarboxylase